MKMASSFVLLTLCSAVLCHPSGNGWGIVPRNEGKIIITMILNKRTVVIKWKQIDVLVNMFFCTLECQDKIQNCEIHRRNGGCLDANPNHDFWRENCVKTCGYCDNPKYNPDLGNLNKTGQIYIFIEGNMIHILWYCHL